MLVTSRQILARGLLHRCPNCGGRTLFAGLLRANARCAACELMLERDEGFFLGVMVINYAATAVSLVVPLLVLVFIGRIGVASALAVAVAWCVLFPIAFYRTSKSLWLMTYYLVFPRELPANQATGSR